MDVASLSIIEKGVSDLANIDEVIKTIDQFQQDPTVLSDYLPDFISTLVGDFFSLSQERRRYAARLFYTFSKVSDVKRVMKHLPTDIFLLPRILASINNLDSVNHWQDLFLLLAWLRMILMAPFKLDNDSAIYELTNVFKSSNALRPLVSGVHAELFAKNTDLLRSNLTFEPQNMHTINYTLKAILRQKDANHTERVMDLSMLNRLTSFCIDPSIAFNEKEIGLVLKILPKLCKFLAIHEEWELIEDVTSWFLSNLNMQFTELRFQLAHAFAKVVFLFTNIDSQSAYSLVEEIVQDSQQAVNSPYPSAIDEDKLHTQLLIIAEVARFQIFDAELLHAVSQDIIPHTIKFQQVKINKITGHQVRDATNFVCWSLVKYCELGDNIETIFLNLLVCSLFDFDLTIRRSSAAALQELLGRYGSKLLSSECIMKIIELPNNNLEVSLSRNVIILTRIFRECRQKYVEWIIEWLINYNVLVNNDLRSVKLTSQSIGNLLATQSSSEISALVLQHLNTASYTIMERKDVSLECRFATLVTDTNILTDKNIKEVCVKCFQHITRGLNPRSTGPREQFQTNCFLKVLASYVAEGSSELKIDSTILDALFLILRYRHPSDQDYEEIKQSFLSIVSTLSYEEKIYEPEHLITNFEQQFKTLVKYNNPLCCAGLPYISPSSFESTFRNLCPQLNCEARFELITALVDRLPLIVKAQGYSVLEMMTGLLDDYTITNRGDEGGIVRKATTELIKKHLPLFMNSTAELKEVTCSKILRLAAEPTEILREMALKILVSAFNFDLSDVSHDMNVLSLYDMHFRRFECEFWSGYLFSAGAVFSTDQRIRNSVDGFLNYYYTLNDSHQLELLNHLVRLLPSHSELEDWRKASSHVNQLGCQKRDLANQAIVHVTFWRRILESGIKVNPNFNGLGAYAKFFNLHLTKKYMRLKIEVVKLMPYIAVGFGQTLEGQKKLINMILKRLKTLAVGRQDSSKELSQLQVLSMEGMSIIYLAFNNIEKAGELRALACTEPKSLTKFDEGL